jgi:hypothetical protein
MDNEMESVKKCDHGLIKATAWSFPGRPAENTEKHL